MFKLVLEIHDDVYTAAKKIRGVEDVVLELEIPEGSVLFENIINLKLLKKESEKIGKSLNFMTFDQMGQNMINMLEEETGGFLHGGFVSKEISLDPFSAGARKILKLPKFPLLPDLAGFKFGKLASRLKFKRPFVIPLVLLLVIGLGILSVQRVHKADIKIITEFQPLTKSVTIKVKKDIKSDASTRILQGISVSTSVTETSSTATTGEKLVGEKAKGKAKIFNKTDAEKVFKKGQVLIYSNNNKDYKYSLNDSVTVQAKTDLVASSTFGETEVSITALDIGTAYNIDNDKSLDVDGYKSSEFTSITSEKITGGKSSTVKVVAEVDLKNLSDLVLKTISDKAQKSLEIKLNNGQKLIIGSHKVVIATQNYSAVVGDETEKLELTETTTINGLAYLSSELNSLIDKVSQDLIPSGFEISGKDREINVEVLGNTDKSVLSPTEADLQVTLKSYVVPEIDINKVKDALVGKTLGDAEKVLGKLLSVKTYELKIVPNFILFGRIPTNRNNINIMVVRE